MMIDVFASLFHFEHHRCDEANSECACMANKDEIINKCKRNFLNKHKENNRKLNANKTSNNHDAPRSLPMPPENHIGLTVESVSNNDDVVLSPQQ